jgi:hypothetical protein
MNRTLSPEFMIDLQEGGRLHPLLERIQKDNTLMLAIRENYINVYYRGGNIIKLKESPKKNHYEAYFDENYDKEELPQFLKDLLREPIESEEHIRKLIDNIPALKQVMDFWFLNNQKNEREFQQLVVRENNRSSISNSTAYFIADIEVAEKDKDIGARFDMLAFKWPSGPSRRPGKVQLALIEMKYGDGALKGESGIVEHFTKMSTYLENKHSEIAEAATKQINQLNKLELIWHEHHKGKELEFTVKDSESGKFEVIFLFANHNPGSEILLKHLIHLKEVYEKNKASYNFDLRFFVASTAGYGMYGECMMDIDRYIKSIESLTPKKVKEKIMKEGTEG